MDYTIAQIVSMIPDPSAKNAVRQVFNALGDALSSRMLNTAGIVIHGAASALAKTGAADCYLSAKGKLVKIPASTDLPALVGTVTNATFGVYCYFCDSAGVVTSVMGTGGATLAAVKFPSTPVNKAMLGFTIINPTGTGDFVGGTTALDDGTVVPNAVHVSVLGPFDPNVLIG